MSAPGRTVEAVVAAAPPTAYLISHRMVSAVFVEVGCREPVRTVNARPGIPGTPSSRATATAELLVEPALVVVLRCRFTRRGPIGTHEDVTPSYCHNTSRSTVTASWPLFGKSTAERSAGLLQIATF